MAQMLCLRMNVCNKCTLKKVKWLNHVFSMKAGGDLQLVSLAAHCDCGEHVVDVIFCECGIYE